MAETENLIFDEGDDVPYLVTVSEDGTPVDITGYKFYLIVKKDLSTPDANAIIDKEYDPSDPTNGKVIIQIDRDDTAGKTSGDYYYAISWKDTSDGIRTILKGFFTITPAANKTI